MVGNMYAGVETVNELGGRCKHDCDYCSTNALRRRWENSRIKYGGEYRLWPSELKKGLGRNKQIFVCGQNDLFEAGVPDDIIKTILQRNAERSQTNTYMIQTKNPARIKDFIRCLPENCMLGTTIETNREDLIKKHSKAPSISERIKAMAWLIGVRPRYVTIEPIMDFDVGELEMMLWAISPDKVYIGADSKKNYLEEPNEKKIIALINEIFEWTEVEIKDNLSRLAPHVPIGVLQAPIRNGTEQEESK